MKDLAVVSAAWGPEAELQAELSFPGFKTYAGKIGADFLTLKPGPAGVLPIFWKNEVVEVFKTHQRVVWFDADCLVRPDCPDLFQLVPAGRYAAHDELERGTDLEVYHRHQNVKNVCLEDGLAVPETGGRHFNTGVYVAPARCAPLFQYPAGEPRTVVAEQSRLNARVFLSREDVYCLPACFNRMVYHHPPRRWAGSSFVAHFAGMFAERRLLDMRALHRTWYG